MRAIAVIPARLASVRFPGKVLADRTGKLLIQHVYERASAAKRIDRVVIAADDARIAKAAAKFGGECVMTRSDHENGTSRIAEAVIQGGLDAPIIVNVQGDEPEIDPAMIDLAVETLEQQPESAIATIAAPFSHGEDPADPNLVKVVLDRHGRALYFSRSLIPFDRDGGRDPEAAPLKHVGLYVYRREFLAQYQGLEQTSLEKAEKLEQLRALEHGYRIAIAVAPAGAHQHGIDTPEQYDAFVKRWNAKQASAPRV